MIILNPVEHHSLRYIANSDPFGLINMSWMPITVFDLSTLSEDMPIFYNSSFSPVPHVYTGGRNKRKLYGKVEPLYRLTYPFHSIDGAIAIKRNAEFKRSEIITFEYDQECLSYTHGERLFYMDTGKPSALLKKLTKSLRLYRRHVAKTSSLLMRLQFMGALKSKQVWIDSQSFETVEVDMEILNNNLNSLDQYGISDIISLASRLNHTVSKGFFVVNPLALYSKDINSYV